MYQINIQKLVLVFFLCEVIRGTREHFFFNIKLKQLRDKLNQKGDK